MSNFVLHLSCFHIALQFITLKCSVLLQKSLAQLTPTDSPKSTTYPASGASCATRPFFSQKLYFTTMYLFQIQSYCSQGCTTSWNLCTSLSWRHYCHGFTLKSLWVKTGTTPPTLSPTYCPILILWIVARLVIVIKMRNQFGSLIMMLCALCMIWNGLKFAGEKNWIVYKVKLGS